MEQCVYVQRCVSVEDYLSPPITNLDPCVSPLSKTTIRKVPILRIFGATQVGQKACVHIHGVFPYLAIPVHQIPGFSSNCLLDIYKELESSLNQSYGSSSGQYIYDMEIYDGIPFYGFHDHEVSFVRIKFYQSKYVKRCAELLLQGALRGCAIQPHEAHFPYSLQFLTDYNIHGMNLIYFKRVAFRVTDKDYATIVTNSEPNYLTEEINESTISKRHMVDPSHAVKKCSSSLELDAKAIDILNVLYTDVRCNPGLKAIRDEQKQHRHHAGKFTPSQNSDESVRSVRKPPQTVKWEEKLNDIIKSSESSFGMDNSQFSALQLLLDLDASQRIVSPKAKSSVSSQEAKICTGVDLSINCNHVSESELSESDEDDHNSIMMSQKVFYDNDSVALSEAKSGSSAHGTKGEPDDEDYFEDCHISDSQLLQLDGNCELEPVKRKRRRLGARPEPKRKLPFRNVKKTNDYTTKNVNRDKQESCKEKFKNPIPSKSQQKLSENKITEPRAANHTSPEVIKLSKGGRSPLQRFDLSNFEELKKSSPKGRKELSKYSKLEINSPESNRVSAPRRSLSLKRSVKRNAVSPCSTKNINPTKKDTGKHIVPRSLFENTPVIKSSEKGAAESILKVAKRLYHDDVLFIPSQESISSCSSEKKSEPVLISDGTSSISGEKKLLATSSQSTQLSDEFRKIEEEQRDINSKVLQWLSESECSQDEADTRDAWSPEKVKNSSPACEKSHKDKSSDLSSKQSTDNSKSLSLLESISYSSLECKKDLDSIVPGDTHLKSKDTSESSSKADLPKSETKSDTKSESLFSPVLPREVTESPHSMLLFSPKEGSSKNPESPRVLSGSDGLSITSTPRLEFDTSLFYSQYNLHSSQQTTVSTESENQILRYSTKPPTYADCLQFMEGDFALKSDNCLSDCNEPNTKNFFYPQTDVELDVVGLDGWIELSDSTSEVSNNQTTKLSLKYSIPPPSNYDAKVWLKDKLLSKQKIQTKSISAKKREVNTVPEMASTPLTTRIKFHSLDNKLGACTPIAAKTPLAKFKNKIFSPTAGTKTPISPTLYFNSQISHLTNNNSFKFALTVPMGDSTRSHVVQHLTIISVECFASSVGRKRPDPRYDSVLAVFYSHYSDNLSEIIDGAICVRPSTSPKAYPKSLTLVETESELFEKFFAVINAIDPDIIVGYEIRNQSVGYLIERASSIGLDFKARVSRFPEEKAEDAGQVDGQPSNWWVTVTNEVQLSGRIIINLWRLMKTEVNLTNYSFENVSYHVLHERVPKFENSALIKIYQSAKSFINFCEYFSLRCKGNLRLLLDLNMTVRTSEMARLFGIEFFNVLSRGSQYRVESMMTRLAKPLGFVSISPSPDQRKGMAAPEYIPLVMEPESKLYTDPVVVLDFQSLYPSMIIAYNLCFSTCLGRVNYLGTYNEFPFGCSNLKVVPELLRKYQDNLFVSPNGVAFVDKSVRHGVLPLMLSEILETRIQVKDMMKQFKEDKALHRMLDARQLALKLIANVTYGYTSANFSGRMPCIEIGDTIVAKGRETLETTIEIINSTPKWGGRVVYGDTDSVFILFKGCSKEQAFARGREIAEYVTSLNPRPVKLKFEKVYQPCVLQTKKRYVGMKYESEEDPGEYEAKGIETVRRDGCPASVKTLKQSLRLLFSTLDVNQVKKYVQNQFMKIIKSQIPIHDYIFAKEYRGMDGYRPAACVPALEIAKKRLKSDPRSEPLVGERVAYIICYGTPGLPLIQLIHEPYEILASTSLKVNSIYYITKAVIPALQRVFSMLNVNVMSWYHELPQDLRSYHAQMAPGSAAAKRTIAHYYQTKHCPFCDGVRENLCECYADTQKVAFLIHSRLSALKSQVHAVSMICGDCSSVSDNTLQSTGHGGGKSSGGFQNHCVSLACPVFFKKVKLRSKVEEVEQISNETKNILNW